MSKTRPLTVLFLASIVFLGLIAGFSHFEASGSPTGAAPMAAQSSSPSNSSFDYIVTIVMENHGYCEVMTACGGSGWNMTFLAYSYSIVSETGYTAVVHPSEGNYVAMIGGDTYGMEGDCGYCPWRSNATNVIDRLEAAGKTFDLWAEEASGSETCNFQPPRGGDHFAFISFGDMNTTSRCSHFHSTTSPADTEFINSLNSPNPANYIWLTPSDNNNCHDNSVPECDTYLGTLVPKILSSVLFTTKKAALFITYDEGNGNYPSDWIYSVWAGPAVKMGYIGTGSYTHYSYLKTLETVWQMPPLTSNDANATAMTEFFGPSTPKPLSASFTVSANPEATVPATFTSILIGGRWPYRVDWDFGDGSTNSGYAVTHTFPAARRFNVTMRVSDSSSPAEAAASVQFVDVAIPPQLSALFTTTPATPEVNNTITFSAIESGGLPPLNFNWTFGDGQNGTGQAISHVYNKPGDYSVELKVVDALNATFLTTSALTISAPSSPDYAVTLAPPSLVVSQGQNASSNIVVASENGFSGTVLFTADADAGLNVVLSKSNVSLTIGTAQTVRVTIAVLPGTNTGSYSATITASDGSTRHTASLSIEAMPMPAPTPTPTPTHQLILALPGTITTVIGSAVRFTVTASEPGSQDNLDLAAQNLPAGSVFDPPTGLFTWTPAFGQTGMYRVVFTARDNGSPPMTASKTIAITVAQPTSELAGTGRCLLCTPGVIVENVFLVIVVPLLGIPVAFAFVYLTSQSRKSRTGKPRQYQNSSINAPDNLSSERVHEVSRTQSGYLRGLVRLLRGTKRLFRS